MTTTSEAQATQRALEGILVLDLTASLGNYCSKLFADLGADVVLVEPPEGTQTRRMEPMIDGRTDDDASLVFQYQNGNKRSIALDLDREEGRDLLRSLASRAHLLIESARPGAMAQAGIGYEQLREIAPQLTVVSITPFGQNGPYAQWQGEDIVGLALGGMLSLAGYPDAAPSAAFGFQAYAAANLFAAVASLAAVYEAEISGQGQHIDVSMQECVVMGMENAVQFYDLEGTIRQRNAGEQRQAGTGVFDCKDGAVYLMAGGIGANRFWGTTVQWLQDEGVEEVELLRADCWFDQDYLQTEEAKRTFRRIFHRFAVKRTKAELYASGQARRIPIAPVANTADILQSRQLISRDFFVEAELGGGTGHCMMPGAPFRLSRTPWMRTRPAPSLGEHTYEIMHEFGIALERQDMLMREGVIR